MESRHVGWIPAESLPWLENQDTDKHIGLSELTFRDGGKVYIASAGTKALNKISSEVRESDTTVNEYGYNKSDTLFLRACHLIAGGTDTEGSSLITRVSGTSEDYNSFSVQGMHESRRPNAKRVYLARTTVGNVRPQPIKDFGIEPTTPLVIRLGISDKQRQLKTLGQLTGLSAKTLRAAGAGAA